MTRCVSPGGTDETGSITSELLSITDGIADAPAWTNYANQISHTTHEAVVLTSSGGSSMRFSELVHVHPP